MRERLDVEHDRRRAADAALVRPRRRHRRQGRPPFRNWTRAVSSPATNRSGTTAVCTRIRGLGRRSARACASVRVDRGGRRDDDVPRADSASREHVRRRVRDAERRRAAPCPCRTAARPRRRSQRRRAARESSDRTRASPRSGSRRRRGLSGPIRRRGRAAPPAAARARARRIARRCAASVNRRPSPRSRERSRRHDALHRAHAGRPCTVPVAVPLAESTCRSTVSESLLVCPLSASEMRVPCSATILPTYASG